MCQQCFYSDEIAAIKVNSCALLCQQPETGGVNCTLYYEACNVTPSPERKAGSEREMEMGEDSKQDETSQDVFVLLFAVCDVTA